jgi:hypothetical protein
MDTGAEGLGIGQQVRLTGRYFVNWEVSRFEVRQPGGWRDGVPTSPLEYLGQPVPADWRHHRGLTFDVTVEATPVAQGAFGHRGANRWQLRVDRWIRVVPMKAWPHHYKGDRHWPLRGYVVVIGSEAQDAVFLRTDLVGLLGATAVQLRITGEQSWISADDAEALRKELVALSQRALAVEDRQTVIQAVELVDYEEANRTGVAVAPPNAE